MGIKDLTDADFKKINEKLKNAGSDLLINPKLAKSINEILPKGIKLELDPQLKAVSNEALAKAVEGKVMKVEVMPLLTHLRKALKDATVASPPEIEVGIQSTKLRTLIEGVLNKHGFMINISTVNDNYTKAVQQKLNGARYTVKIHADANEITRSVQASLMQVQSRSFGLKVSRDILYRSIDEALGNHRFPITVYVRTENARNAVQTALSKAGGLGTQDILNHQRLMKAEAAAAAAELNRLKAAHMGAADAAKAHATASVNLGGAMGSNIKIAGELGSAMTSLYSIHAAKQFLSQVVEIGGELEHQKIAMNTIFGDKGKTNELFGQIKGLARTSPFGVMELSKSVKALSAYGVQYNEIYETAKRLADISAATSVDINRLILAFGKTRSRGFLDGLEAKQFAYANIPIYEMVRKKLEELEGQAVTTADVMARMKKREIGFDIVKDVLWDITDPGGKFYNMQEALAGSVKTSWKLVRDNIELMFGEIAESNVGGALKDVAEILQVLTRNWKAMGTVIGAAALTFGVYRVAVAASNQMMGLHNAEILKSVTASNLATTAKLSEVAVYRNLNAVEQEQFILKSALAKLNRSLLLTHKELNASEWEAAFVNGKVTEEYILRRIALGKLTKAEIDFIVTSGMVDAKLVQTAVAASNTKFSLVSLYATIKTGSKAAWLSFLSFCTRVKAGVISLAASIKAINLASMWTWIRTLPTRMAHAEFSVTRLKLAFAGLGRTLASVGAFLLHPATIAMAAIGGVMYAWQKNNEQMEKAKEIGDNIFTKATEGASSLSQTLKGIKPSAGLSEHELTQGIEQMEQAIKDYSPKPLQDINDTLVAQDGHVLTLAERYDALKKKVEGVAEAYRLMGDVEKGDVGTMVSSAIKSTGGLLNDTVTVNAKDYSEALKRRSDAIREAAKGDERWIKKAVDAAMKADGAFAKAAAGMKTTAAMWEDLASNPEKYGDVEYRIPEVSAALTGIKGINRDINEDKAKFESDVQDFIKDLTANVRITWDKEIKDLDASQKDALAITLKNMLDQADGVSDSVKMLWAQKLEDAFKVTIIEDKIGPAVKDGFVSAMNNASDASIVAVADKWKNEGWDALSDAEQQIVYNMMDDAHEKTMALLGTTQEEMQKYLQNNPLTQTIKLAYEELGTNEFQKEVWNDKLAKRLSESIPTPLSGAGGLTDDAKKAREWYNSWTRGGGGYKEAQDRYNTERKAIVDEIKAAKNASNEWLTSKQDALDAMDALATDMGLQITKKGGGADGSKKDEFAESLKQRFKDIKDAYAMFKEWAKLEGKEAAFKRVGESGLFATLDPDKVPQTVDEYLALIDELEKELKAAGIKGKSQRESLANDIVKERFGINKDTFKEQLQLALDKVSKEAERQLADWNLYEKVRKATGNETLAFNLAFGMNGDGQTDYVRLMKDRFDAIAKEYGSAFTYDTATPELLQKEGIQEVQKAYEQTYGDISKYHQKESEEVADILAKYQSLQDKIAKIDYDRNEEIRKINESKDLTPEQKAQTIQRINVEADYQKFTQSNEYLQFFAGIYALTEQEATRIGDLIEQHLNRQLQLGRISAEDYYKEIERIKQQLDKLRNVKSDAMTFLTGGVKGLSEKRQETNNAKRLEITQKIADLESRLQKAREEGDKHQEGLLMAQLRGARTELSLQDKIRDKIIKNKQQWQSVLDVANIVSNIAGGLSDAFGSIKDMADAFGVDTETGGWLDVGGVLDTLSSVTSGVSKAVQSAMSGDVGGILGGVVSTLTTPFTIWAQLHDKKLQKQIEEYSRIYDLLDSQLSLMSERLTYALGSSKQIKDPQAESDRQKYYAALQRAQTGAGFSAQIGGITAKVLRHRVEAYEEGGVYAYQRALMEEQRNALIGQRNAEADKKDSDQGAIDSYNSQIASLEQQIRDFAETAIETLYGINLRSFAEDIGSALIDAFAKGEDAAEAFDEAVGDIMRDVVKQMAIKNILEQQFEGMRTFLFGTDGMSGAFGEDFELDAEEAAALKIYFDKIKNEAIPAVQKLFDGVNDATGGLLEETDKAKSGLTAGIQAMTESTGDLVASYLNGIRGDVSVQTHELWPRLLDVALPQISVIAQSQLDAQRQIAENTLRNAVAAEAIAKSNNDISRLLTRVSQGGAKFHIQ